MKLRFLLTLGAIVAQSVLAGPGSLAAETFSFEDDLKELTRAMTRLVETIEKQTGARAVEQDLGRLQIAVSILEIRNRRHEAIRRELQDLEESGAAVARYKTQIESELDNLEERIVAASDETTANSLRIGRDDILIEIQSLESKLEHTRGRELDVQGRLIQQQRSVQQVEELIDAWLADFELSAERRKRP